MSTPLLSLPGPVLAADSAAYVQALTMTFSNCIPEAILVAAACVLYLGGTWKPGRDRWGLLALLAIIGAGVVVAFTPPAGAPSRAALYLTPLVHDHLAMLFRWLGLVGGALLVLLSWDEVPEDEAADYHACLLVITAG